MDSLALNRTQQMALVLLRTLIGWHFLYEGLVKLVWPAWTRAGVPLGRFSSAGYLRSSTGPFADVFRAFADASWLPWLDLLMGWGLLLVGLGLMLGLFTQLACAGALALLALFYLSWLPTRGVYEPGHGGQLPPGQQEPRRGGGGLRRSRVPNRSHRRARPRSSRARARRRRPSRRPSR